MIRKNLKNSEKESTERGSDKERSPSQNRPDISSGHLRREKFKQWSPMAGKDTIWAEALWWTRSWRTSWGTSPWPCHSHRRLWTSLRRNRTRARNTDNVYIISEARKKCWNAQIKSDWMWESPAVSVPGRGRGSEHMVQILSYTSRPTDKWDYSQKTFNVCFYWTERYKDALRTKSVEDISDENKLAGVELDHRGVGQKLRALEHRSLFKYLQRG